jgi:hypothetical protein
MAKAGIGPKGYQGACGLPEATGNANGINAVARSPMAKVASVKAPDPNAVGCTESTNPWRTHCVCLLPVA